MGELRKAELLTDKCIREVGDWAEYVAYDLRQARENGTRYLLYDALSSLECVANRALRARVAIRAELKQAGKPA